MTPCSVWGLARNGSIVTVQEYPNIITLSCPTAPYVFCVLGVFPEIAPCRCISASNKNICSGGDTDYTINSEVTELRLLVQQKSVRTNQSEQASDILSAAGSWSNVTKCRTKRSPKLNPRVPSESGGPTANTNPLAHKPASLSHHEPQGTKVLVEGKRKIWGTLKVTTSCLCS